MQDSVPASRAYIHDRCHQDTIVGDAAFVNLASPLSDIHQTYCSGCKGMFDVHEFAWSDTRECLIDYRARHSTGAGSFARFICSRNAVLIMFVISIGLALVGAMLLSPIQQGLLGFLFTAIGVGFVALIALATLLIRVITPMVHKHVCGVSDPRALK